MSSILSNSYPVAPFVVKGAAFGLEELEGLKFMIDREFTACLICGDVFQSAYDRHPLEKISGFLPNLQAVALFAASLRKEWSHKHAKEHPERVHQALRDSGRFYTPEAAIKLAAFGIISAADLAMDDEVNDALRQSSPIPTDDAQGT
jgi:hypothetical protein